MPLQFRNGASSGRTAVTPAQGEPLWDTDTKRLYVGDGTTPGGNAVGVTSSGVSQLIAGTNVTLSPASGVGNVTVSVTGTGVAAYTVKRYARFASRAAALQAGAPQTTTGLNANWARSPDIFTASQPYTHTSYQVLGAYVAGAGYAATLTLGGTSGGSFTGGTSEQYTDTIANNGHTAGTFAGSTQTFTVGGSSGNTYILTRNWYDAAVNTAQTVSVFISNDASPNQTVAYTTDGFTINYASIPTLGTSTFNGIIWDSANNRFIIYSQAGVYWTSPDGINWTRGVISTVVDITTLAVNTAGSLYVINGGAYWANSLTGTWTPGVGFPSGVIQTSFANNAFFAQVGGTLYRTIDPTVNNNWASVGNIGVSSGFPSRVVYFSGNYYLGGNGTYVNGFSTSATATYGITSTTGTSWSTFYSSSVSGFSSASFSAVFFIASGTLYSYTQTSGGFAINAVSGSGTIGGDSSRHNIGTQIVPAFFSNIRFFNLASNSISAASPTGVTWSGLNNSPCNISCSIPYITNAVGTIATSIFNFNLGGNLTGNTLITALVSNINSNAPLITGPLGTTVPAFTATTISATQFSLSYAFTGAVTAPTLTVGQSGGGSPVSNVTISVAPTAGITPSTVTFNNVQVANNRVQLTITGAPTTVGAVYTWPVTGATAVGVLTTNVILDAQTTLQGAVTEIRGTVGVTATGTVIRFGALNVGSNMSAITSISIDTNGFPASTTALQALTTGNFIFVQSPDSTSTTSTVILTSGGDYVQIAKDIAQFFNTSEVAYTATALNGVATITASANINYPDINQSISAGTNGTIVSTDFAFVKVRDGSPDVATGTPTTITFTKAANAGAGTFSVTLGYADSATSAASIASIINILQNRSYYAYQSSANTITIQDADPTSGGTLTPSVNNGSGPVGTVTAVVTQTSAGVAEVINASTTGWSSPINEGTQVL